MVTMASHKPLRSLHLVKVSTLESKIPDQPVCWGTVLASGTGGRFGVPLVQPGDTVTFKAAEALQVIMPSSEYDRDNVYAYVEDKHILAIHKESSLDV
jgi:hypothetical protein